MDVYPTRIGIHFRRTIESGFQQGNHSLGFGKLRSRSYGGWHLSGTDFMENFFPDFSVLGDGIDFHSAQRQSASPCPVVVTGNAMPFNKNALRGRRSLRTLGKIADG